MGPPEIKYGESLCFVQHVASGLWLTYAAPDPKALRLGVLKKKVGAWSGAGWAAGCGRKGAGGGHACTFRGTEHIARAPPRMCGNRKGCAVRSR